MLGGSPLNGQIDQISESWTISLSLTSGFFWEDPLAVGPEAEDCSQRQTNDVRADVVRDDGVKTECVVGEPQTTQRDPHADDVQDEEQHVFAAV